MKKLLFLVAILMLGNTSFAQDVNKLLGDYLAIKDALVNSDSKVASQALNTFLQSIKADGDYPEKKALLKAVGKMAKADNIESQRAGFNDVSKTMWKIVKKSDQVKGPVYYQYCPMKKTYWLSREKEIRNPYYGSAMLTCGKVVETRK